MERTGIYNFHLERYQRLNVYKIAAINVYEVKCHANMEMSLANMERNMETKSE